jgi:hypothetical protein
MEELMRRLLTYIELTRYSKAQLWDLLRQINAALPGLAEGSVERKNALLNIQNVRMFLARPEYRPC